MGLSTDTPVILERGNDWRGITHLWHLFVAPDKSVKLLQETLGNPNCRVVVSLERTRIDSHTAGKKIKKICLKRIVLHNQQKGIYCVMIQRENELRLVSWNESDDNYGRTQWNLK